MPSKAITFLSAIIALSLFLNSDHAAYADDEMGNALWFANLASANNTKTFCAPKGTTLTQAAQALEAYSKAHPELHGRVTDPQAIQALSERYPCAVKMTPELQKTEITRLPRMGPRNIEATPRGEYATVDNKPSIIIMQKLNATTGHESDDLLNRIVEKPSDYSPPVLFAAANLLYKQEDFSRAIFWFNAARLRGMLDAALCTDKSAVSAVAILAQQAPRDLIKRQYDDLDQTRSMLDSVIQWDEATPYNYDHRWISLHGISAITSGMESQEGITSIIVPKDTWGSLAQKNRDDYRKMIGKSMDFYLKQRAGGKAEF